MFRNPLFFADKTQHTSFNRSILTVFEPNFHIDLHGSKIPNISGYFFFAKMSHVLWQPLTLIFSPIPDYSNVYVNM